MHIYCIALKKRSCTDIVSVRDVISVNLSTCSFGQIRDAHGRIVLDQLEMLREAG